MNISTKCNKCIFADYSDSEHPCALSIIDQIKDTKVIEKIDNFNKILNYRCAFAFDQDVYKNNVEQIGTIDNLKRQLYSRAKIDYYMVIIIDDDSIISDIIKSLKELEIEPKFVSLVITNSNNTKSIIDLLKSSMPQTIKWKLHNLLEEYSFQEILDIIFETNTEKDNIRYFWVNNNSSISSWSKDIIHINQTIVIKQPFLHALFRKNMDGLFLTFNNYKKILDEYQTDILSAISDMEDKAIIYYG